MQSQDGGTEGTGPTSVSAQQAAQFWGKGPVELALLGNGHRARQVSLLPYWHRGNSHTHTHTHMREQGHQGQSVGGCVCVCVCVWYSGLDHTWMRRAKQQLCRNVCTLLFNSLSPCLSISPVPCDVGSGSVFFSLQTFHPSPSSLICPSNPTFLSSLCLPSLPPANPLDPHALIVLQEAQSRGVCACVCLCVGVCDVCVLCGTSSWLSLISSPVLRPWQTRTDNRRHADMLLSFMCVNVVWVLQYAPHETMKLISLAVDLAFLFLLWHSSKMILCYVF